MDGDPAGQSALDSFSLTFPLPYRIGFIITLAVWGWALNLHYLALRRVDVPSLIRYPTRSSPHHAPHHHTTYRLAVALTGLFGASITIFWAFTRRNAESVIALDWIPVSYLFALACVFFVPLRNLPGPGRRRFLATLRRVSIGGIAEAQDGKFGDILLADVLTSYARVCADLYVTLFVPILLALPSIIRLRQCLIEYFRVRRAPYKESTGWGGQHLANALKYSTAFPVIITSTMQRSATTEERQTILLRAWIVAAMVNSLYSFYWDVTKDWDLALFVGSRERNAPQRPYGLRDRLVFRPVNVYYGVIALDLILRCTWSMKLSPHLDKFSDFESGIFVVELLEVLRRWVWIFFRVETEWLRNTATGLGVDDILLGDYDKYDDDD